jgi:hypothetical protein
MQTVDVFISSGAMLPPVTVLTLRQLQVNVVKTFSPGDPIDISMDIGDAKSINLGSDSDTSCYEVVPSSSPIFWGGNGLTLTPSASNILDITASQKGAFTVKVQL